MYNVSKYAAAPAGFNPRARCVCVCDLFLSFSVDMYTYTLAVCRTHTGDAARYDQGHRIRENRVYHVGVGPRPAHRWVSVKYLLVHELRGGLCMEVCSGRVCAMPASSDGDVA